MTADELRELKRARETLQKWEGDLGRLCEFSPYGSHVTETMSAIDRLVDSERLHAENKARNAIPLEELIPDGEDDGA